MSNQAAVAPLPSVLSPSAGLLPADPPDDLLDRLADYLVPLFVTDAEDMRAARLMAVRTIAAYLPETQADLINIGRTIAFSMSALAALGRVASEDMPPALQLRYFARATVLNRAAEQSERSMERRRGVQRSSAPPPEVAQTATDLGDGAAEPDLASAEVAIEAAVAEAIRNYTAKRQSAASRTPANMATAAGAAGGAAAPASYQRSAQPVGLSDVRRGHRRGRCRSPRCGGATDRIASKGPSHGRVRSCPIAQPRMDRAVFSAV
jgi:hypothetical protein